MENKEKNSLLIPEEDITKSLTEIKELTVDTFDDYLTLFNLAENKKSLARAIRLGEVENILINQAYLRFVERPDEIDNKQLLDAVKLFDELRAKNTEQATAKVEADPLIQINNQKTEINVTADGGIDTLPRESRAKLQQFFANLMKQAEKDPVEEIIDGEIVDAEFISEEQKENE